MNDDIPFVTLQRWLGVVACAVWCVLQPVQVALAGIQEGAAQTVPAPGGAVPEPEYIVGPGDNLSIRVYGVKDLAFTARVSNSGKIRVPHLGILLVDGLTVRQIELTLTSRFLNEGLLNDPWVQVRVEQYRAHPVYILGDVVQPGQFVITGRLFLLDLIAMAEGLTSKADPIAYLYRLPSGTTADRKAAASDKDETKAFAAEDVVTVDLGALVDGSAPETNLELRGGDVLYVREKRPDYIYVVGAVTRPGMYEIYAGKTILLSQAVAGAGGPARTAKTSRCVVVRSTQTGVQQEVPFDLQSVMTGKQPDFPVGKDDIVFIPGSTVKTVAQGLLGVVPNVAVSAATSSR